MATAQELREAIATNKKNHEKYKREIKEYIIGEGKKAFEMWKKCQERHFKLSS